MKVSGWENDKLQVEVEPRDTWCAATTIASIIAPILKTFKENAHGFPASMDKYVWDQILDSMIFAFEKIRDNDAWDFTPEEITTINHGLLNFSKFYFDLWD